MNILERDQSTTMATQLSDGEVIEFLENQRTLILASTRKSGSPVMHALWFTYLDNAIYINIQRDSFKYRNIQRDPRLCCLIEAGESYFELRGVMIEGEATEVTSDERILAVQDAQDAKHQRIGSGTKGMPAYFEQSREQRLKRGDRALIKIPMSGVRTWDFGKARSHYENTTE